MSWLPFHHSTTVMHAGAEDECSPNASCLQGLQRGWYRAAHCQLAQGGRHDGASHWIALSALTHLLCRMQPSTRANSMLELITDASEHLPLTSTALVH